MLGLITRDGAARPDRGWIYTGSGNFAPGVWVRSARCPPSADRSRRARCEATFTMPTTDSRSRPGSSVSCASPSCARADALRSRRSRAPTSKRRPLRSSLGSARARPTRPARALGLRTDKTVCPWCRSCSGRYSALIRCTASKRASQEDSEQGDHAGERTAAMSSAAMDRMSERSGRDALQRCATTASAMVNAVAT